jgi:hypothetical protein
MINLFILTLLMTLISSTLGQTHIQRIIGTTPIDWALFGMGLAASGDWAAITNYKGELHFMKWDGAMYNTAGRQVIDISSYGMYMGTNLKMVGDWAILGGQTDKTAFFKKTGETWALDHALTDFGTKTNRYPDVYMAGAGTLDMSNDGTRLVVYDNSLGVIRVYELSGDTWSPMGTDTNVDTEMGGDSQDLAISEDGTKIVLCSKIGEKCVVKKWDAGTWDNTVQILAKADPGSPSNTATTPFGISVEMNTDGSMIAVTQNWGNNVNGYVHWYKEVSPGTYTVSQTIADDTNTYGTGLPDNFGSDLEYYNGLWYVCDGLHTSSVGEVNQARRGGAFVYREGTDGLLTQVFDIRTSDLPNDIGMLNDAGFAHRLAFSDNRVLVYAMFFDEPSLTNTGDGSVEVFSIPEQTPFPTVPPTLSPTPSPTLPLFVPVGTAKVSYNMVNSIARKTAAKQTISDVKKTIVAGTTVEVKVTSKETSSVPSTFINSVGETAFKAAYASSRGCVEDCVVTLSTDNRRILQGGGGGEIKVSLDFTLSEAAYDALVAGGSEVDSEAFLDSLASELGVNKTDIVLTVIGGQVQIDITLMSAVGGDPTNQDTIDSLVEIQSSLNNVTAIFVTALGGAGDTITLVELDLCDSRTCSGEGIFTSGVTTTAGCVISTGVCKCNAGFWGVNCDSVCSCLYGGICVGSLCQCVFPYFGLKCENIKTCVSC